jgi:hypothetical protein
MFRTIFLLLIFTVFNTYAEAQENQKAYKFFEFEKISNVLLKEKFINFMKVLEKDGASQGYIITYGTDKFVANREKQVLKIDYRSGVQSPRLTFVNGKNTGKPRTIFFVVPAGAETPVP